MRTENRAAHRYIEKQGRLKMEKTIMNKLKLLLTTAAALLVPFASAPVFAKVRPLHLDRTQTQTDNSGWNGYNNGGYNNTWYDGKEYRSGPMPLGEDIASDAASLTR
jgi:hypothetical protein